jgi:hypothetical protein
VNIIRTPLQLMDEVVNLLQAEARLNGIARDLAATNMTENWVRERLAILKVPTEAAEQFVSRYLAAKAQV